MGVPQFTTPEFTLTFPDIEFDLTEMRGIYVTFRSHGRTITKTGDDLTVTADSITLTLNQIDTAMLHGMVEIQVNWVDGAGRRIASEIETAEITDQLLKRVVT